MRRGAKSDEIEQAGLHSEPLLQPGERRVTESGAFNAFAANGDIDAMRKVVQDFCADRFRDTELRSILETQGGFDKTGWKALGEEMGALGLAAPESAGGLALGFQAQASIVEELGAALVPGPVVGTLMLAIPALSEIAEEKIRNSYLPLLLSGERCAAFAVPESGGRFASDMITVTADHRNGNWRLDGAFENLVDGPTADMIMVAAKTDEDIALFAVEASEDGVARQLIPTLDLTRPQETVTFDSACGTPLARGNEARRACEHAFRAAIALIAAEQIGGADRVLSMTIDHLNTRVQFGRFIGSFQALKHRAADLSVMLEQARSAARYAAWHVDEAGSAGGKEVDRSLSLAKALASDAYYQVTAASVQLHGGVGFVWEHPLHFYFKRAVTDAALFGAAQHHRNTLAELVLERDAETALSVAPE